MIEYGIACLVAVLLSLLDKRALPVSIVLLMGWLAGFGPIETWPAISFICGTILFGLFLHTGREWWKAGIAACVPVMLSLDIVYWLSLKQGFDFSRGYETGLNVLFALQLLLAGYPGAKNGANRILSWRVRRLRAGRGMARDES
jgi:peptidoglycan/LPS O-acetylase OafA/YrhL